MALVSLALGACSFVFFAETNSRVRRLVGDQALELATALAHTSENAMTAGADRLLADSAANLIKGSNIVFVGYYRPDGAAIVQRSRDPDFESSNAPRGAAERGGDVDAFRRATRSLLRVRNERSALFDQLFVVTAPVFSSPPQPRPGPGATADSSLPDSDNVRVSSKLLGYVTVALSAHKETSELRRANVMVLGAGCILAMLALPLSYLVVWRIFHPIRTLVAAAQRITSGDLDARVDLDRPDAIGELARSFNELVGWVKHHQQQAEDANARLADANRGLERKVEQRTSQLETANQRLSQEIAEKEDFLRAVSHDLNAPLRNISGMATMLLMKHRAKFDEDIVHRLERIKSNVDVETDLINELLELSRIKTRRQKMECVDVERMIWDLRGLFENDLKGRAIDLLLDTSLPILFAERARIRQVFQNLIDNAIKYMGSGIERRIHIGCEVRDTEADFYVRDTGMGIEPDDLDKVFHVFRRGKSGATQNIAGKGVGLASVKSIIETYSGRIWVESTLGVGSTFRFTINGMHLWQEGLTVPTDGDEGVEHDDDGSHRRDERAAVAAV